jgi:hypothetical protein
MPLSTEQEAKVVAIIDAFDNGKKISDLPPAIGGLENYIAEVQDISGESKQINFYNAIATVNKKIAVRRWNETLATPVSEAWGNLDFLRDLPGILGLGCYLVKNDRTRRKLDPTNHYKFQDGTPATLNGSMGQYMWCWNAHYYAYWKEGDYLYEAVSPNPIDRGECYRVPSGGTSAFGAGVVDRTNNLLCSVISD